MTKECFATAQRNLRYVKDMHSLYAILRHQTNGALDLSDLLRSEVVMAVSTLDQFVHELIKQGMMDIYDGTRSLRTEQFLQFPLCLRVLSFGTTDPPAPTRDAYELEVTNYLGLRTYQKSCDISQGLHLISPGSPWETAGRLTGRLASDLKRDLNLIVDRRNAIVHQADTDPVTRSRIPMLEQDAQGATEFIETIVGVLFQHCL
jgi:hypothetical protein